MAAGRRRDREAAAAARDSSAECIRLCPAKPDAGLRIDSYISRSLLEISRSQVKRLIEGGHVRVVSGDTSWSPKPSYQIRAGDLVEVHVPPLEPASVSPEEIPLDIVYEDSSVIVINKPRGLVVHPAPGNRSGTLVNALLNHCRDLAGIGGVQRPGIVHRLDKDTSGLMVVAKDDDSYASLAGQIRSRTAVREYAAIVHGVVAADSGRIEAPIGRHPVNRKRMAVVDRGGKPAVTYFDVLGRAGDYTLVRCRLGTGRTHQIRVHMSYIGHPIVGDPVYARRRHGFAIRGQALHACHLEFDHPRSGERMSFYADMPEDMQEILCSLNLTSRTRLIDPDSH